MSGVIALAGCSAFGAVDEPAATSTPTMSIDVTPTPSESTEPGLAPEGTAAENLAYFTAVVDEVWAGADADAGRSYVDALVAAGFDKAAMQVTEDMSTVGNPAESIQFSVEWGEECLVGQVGPATGDPFTVVVDALPGGGCLLGQTRPIDW